MDSLTERIAISNTRYADEFPFGLSLEDKIDVFFNQTLHWQLLPAKRIAKEIPDSGFAVLHIVMSYFEKVAKYQAGYKGKGDSEKYFRLGFESVFPFPEELEASERERLTKLVYKQVRNGLYHLGLTQSRVRISGDYEEVISISITESIIRINPLTIVNPLENHLRSYVARLKDPQERDFREKFERRFDCVSKDE